VGLGGSAIEAHDVLEPREPAACILGSDGADEARLDHLERTSTQGASLLGTWQLLVEERAQRRSFASRERAVAEALLEHLVQARLAHRSSGLFSRRSTRSR
jgi:hypothetical protein